MDKQLSLPKQEFLDQILNSIRIAGFEEVDWGYEKISVHQQQGQTIIINGQRMDQPGKSIQIKQTIFFNGDGWIADENEENKKEFTQIKFEILRENQVIMTYEDCFYWDDINHFNHIFNNIFK